MSHTFHLSAVLPEPLSYEGLEAVTRLLEDDGFTGVVAATSDDGRTVTLVMTSEGPGWGIASARAAASLFSVLPALEVGMAQVEALAPA